MDLVNYVISLPEVSASWPDSSLIPLLFLPLALPQFTAFMPPAKAGSPFPEQPAPCLDVVLPGTLTTGLPAVTVQQPVGIQALGLSIQSLLLNISHLPVLFNLWTL